MTAYNTPAGSSTSIPDLPTVASTGQGSGIYLVPVYPYSPPNDGQTWPRPY